MTADPGEAVLTRLDDGRLRVDRADPVIWITNELLDAENVRIERDGDVLTFGDVGRVSYRITGRHSRHVAPHCDDCPIHHRCHTFADTARPRITFGVFAGIDYTAAARRQRDDR